MCLPRTLNYCFFPKTADRWQSFTSHLEHLFIEKIGLFFYTNESSCSSKKTCRLSAVFYFFSFSITFWYLSTSLAITPLIASKQIRFGIAISAFAMSEKFQTSCNDWVAPELILCMYIFRFCRKHIHFLQNRTKFLLYYCLCFLLHNLTVVLLFRFLSYYLSVLMNYNLFF